MEEDHYIGCECDWPPKLDQRQLRWMDLHQKPTMLPAPETLGHFRPCSFLFPIPRLPTSTSSQPSNPRGQPDLFLNYLLQPPNTA